jgi:hypothetical protein
LLVFLFGVVICGRLSSTPTKKSVGRQQPWKRGKLRAAPGLNTIQAMLELKLLSSTKNIMTNPPHRPLKIFTHASPRNYYPSNSLEL